MLRWYLGFQAVGNAKDIIERIRAIVRRYHLGRFIPVVRVEKRPRGQFLVFVGIESPAKGEIPPELEPLFQLHNLTHPQEYIFTLDQIRRMVSGPMEVQDYAPTIPYLEPPPLDPDPFGPPSEDEGAAEPESELDAIMDRSQRYERLWLWLSAVGSGNWAAFQKACKALRLEGDGMTARRILRRLRLLGHIECSPDGNAWCAAPTVLLPIHVGATEPTYLVCGQQSVPLLAALRARADVGVVPQPNGVGPAAIRVRTDDVGSIRAELAAEGEARPVPIPAGGAVTFARALPDLRGWVKTLPVLEGVQPYMHDLKCFAGEEFVPQPFTGKSGFYEFWPKGGATSTLRPAYSLFYDAEAQRWLRGDWYGLRFLAFQGHGVPCPIDYDAPTGRLCVHEAFRWPELYERALVLASGRLPALQDAWLLYEGITHELLDVLGTKLNLRRVEDDNDA